jgi:hypothetical protein
MMLEMRVFLSRGIVLAAALAAVAFGVSACSNEEEEHQVTIGAQIVEAGAPASVAAANLREEDGLIAHEVRVTWNGDGPAFLDDARFTHHVTSNGGDLVLSGRGCGADYDEESRQAVFPCTADLQIVRLEPGGTHAYPVRIHPEVGPLKLEAGTYVVEQQVSWWRAEAGEQFPNRDPDGMFTISLTYTVE